MFQHSNPVDNYQEPLRSELYTIQAEYRSYYEEPVKRLNLIEIELDVARKNNDGITINNLLQERASYHEHILELFHECAGKLEKKVAEFTAR